MDIDMNMNTDMSPQVAAAYHMASLALANRKCQTDRVAFHASGIRAWMHGTIAIKIKREHLKGNSMI